MHTYKLRKKKQQQDPTYQHIEQVSNRIGGVEGSKESVPFSIEEDGVCITDVIITTTTDEEDKSEEGGAD